MQRFNGKATSSGLVVTEGLNSTNTADLTFASATVQVNVVGGGLATIFSDNVGTPLANPFTANTDATFSFYAANGRYTVSISGSGVPSITITDILLFDSSLLNAGSSNALAFSATPVFNAALFSTFTMTLTGNVTSSTLSGGTTGQIVFLMLTQGAGGPWTFAWPANVANPPTFTPTAAKTETFILELMPDGLWHVVGMGEYPLNQIASVTGTGGTIVFQNSPVLNTPTVNSMTLTGTITGNINNGTGSLISGAATLVSINNVVLLGSSTYPCTGAGLNSAIAAVVAAGGGDVDARGCQGTISSSGFTLGASGGSPVRLLVGPSTWNMSGSITMNRGSGLIGTDNQTNQFIWTTDITGITTPAGTTGGLITIANVALNNQNLATAANAVILLQDCPRPTLYNVIVSISSSAASAGIRLKSVTSNSQFGTWQPYFTNVTIQRGGLLGRPTSGQIGLDLVGNSGLTNGAISLGSFVNMWIENQTIDINCNQCTNNTWFGGNIYSATNVQVQITGTGGINSNGNAFINTTFNQVGLAGATNIVTIDNNSNFNYISGNISGPTSGVYISDIGSKNIHAVHTDVGDDFNGGGTLFQSNNYVFNEISAVARPGGVAGQDILSGDSLNHGILASFNGGSFTNNYLLAANTPQTIRATMTWTANQVYQAQINFATTLLGNTAPTIAANGCGGSAASIPTNNGTGSFTVNVGTTPGSACTITLPAAANGWNCYATDITTNSTAVDKQKQTATGATTATITNFSDVSVATAFVANDILQVSCFGR